MPAAYSSVDRAASVSSIRSKNRPPFFRAQSQLWTAVRMLPTCSLPVGDGAKRVVTRSEEHTSELQSLMRISYAVFCLKKKNTNIHYKDSSHNSDTTISAR